MDGENTPNFLEMTDEEIANFDMSSLNNNTTETNTENNTEGATKTDPNATATDLDATGEGEGSGTDTSGLTGGTENPEAGEIDPAAGGKTVEDPEATGTVDPNGKKESTQEETKPEDEGSSQTKVDPNKDQTKETPIDYEAAYKKLTAPFKANGRDIQINSVDDAINLMQMGANYNKKMAALKPNLKVMRLLENNGLLSEEKLTFLIDLDKKNPEAIAKLIKDANIDPLELDPSKAGDYKTNVRLVDDKEIALDNVLDEIQDTPTYNRMLKVVSNDWDAQSKEVIASQPQLLKIINTHMESGIYDLISTEIERERMFGRLNGLSDIEAYRQVGDAINARNGFAHLNQSQGQQTQTAAPVVPPKPKLVDESKRREKKLAAAGTQAAAPAKVDPEFNPLNMSDADFEKLVKKQF